MKNKKISQLLNPLWFLDCKKYGTILANNNILAVLHQNALIFLNVSIVHRYINIEHSKYNLIKKSWIFLNLYGRLWNQEIVKLWSLFIFKTPIIYIICCKTNKTELMMKICMIFQSVPKARSQISELLNSLNWILPDFPRIKRFVVFL